MYLFSRYFYVWRGSVKLRMKIVKTQYHSGRLEIIWVPLGTITAGFQRDTVYREIVDIRSTNEFEFTVPWVSDRPWRGTGDSIGHFYIRVLNPLKAPSTVSSDVKLQTFLSAGPDFQFGIPCDVSVAAGEQIVPHYAPPPSESGAAKAQSNAQMFKFGEGNSVTDFKMNNQGVGEAIVSLRQLIHRAIEYPVSPGLHVPEELCAGLPGTALDSTFPNYFANMDYIGLLSALFRWRAGGMNIHAYPKTSPPATPVYKFVLDPAMNRTDAPHTPSRNLAPTVWYFPTVEPLLTMNLPFYYNYPAAPTELGMPRGNPGNFTNTPWTQFTNVNPTAPASFDDLVVLRSAAEDTTFGYLIGPPELWTFSS